MRHHKVEVLVSLAIYAVIGAQNLTMEDYVLNDMVLTARAANVFPSKGNTVTSPANVLAVTIMVAEAAESSSQAKILNTIKPGMTMPEARDLFRQLAAGDDGKSSFFARAVWSKKDPWPEAKALYSRVYDSEVGGLPTQDQADKWARHHTREMVKQFPVSTARAYAIFASALAYINEWEGEKKDEVEMPFEYATGQRNIKGFSIEGTEASVNGISAFKLPYKNEDEMLILFDETGSSTPSVVNSWDPAQWKSALEVSEGESVNLHLPKFEFDVTTDFINAWISRGRPAMIKMPAFYTAEEQFLINEAAFISVDEKGTRAASVAVGMAMASIGPRKVVIDRPFVFAIVRPGYPLPLFIGTVNEPTSN